ncbi:MAG: hydrogenase expression/formation protein HypE [Synechococcales cyanobacterium]
MSFRDPIITLAHGSGGRAMHDLIDQVLVKALQNPLLDPTTDQARIPLAQILAYGDRLAFTTDSYVVDPLIFPGGDIGRLAVCGTVNDLAMGGAIPLFLSCGLIIEEGLPLATLERVITSLAATAAEVGVTIVTGDTKVVPRGAADQLFINTAGIGGIPTGLNLSSDTVQVGDVVLVNGYMGDHGTAILAAREELALETPILSDCQPLHNLVQTLLQACSQVRVLRDLTRGGLATILNEVAAAAHVRIDVDESALPIRPEVHALCEILGLDPLYLANEGKLMAVVPASQADLALATLQSHPLGTHARIIGQVVARDPGTVVLQTPYGSERILDMLQGELLPRIC